MLAALIGLLVAIAFFALALWAERRLHPAASKAVLPPERHSPAAHAGECRHFPSPGLRGALKARHAVC